MPAAASQASHAASSPAYSLCQCGFLRCLHLEANEQPDEDWAVGRVRRRVALGHEANRFPLINEPPLRPTSDEPHDSFPSLPSLPSTASPRPPFRLPRLTTNGKGPRRFSHASRPDYRLFVRRSLSAMTLPASSSSAPKPMPGFPASKLNWKGVLTPEQVSGEAPRYVEPRTDGC